MAKTMSLGAEIREDTGSKAAEAVRKQGRIPVIVYGHQEPPVAISVNAHDFSEGLHHGLRLVDITIGGKNEKAIVKELQYDHLGRQVIHADLMRVDVTESVEVTVPIELKGTPKGAHEGGVLSAHSDRLEVRCLAVNIPESVVVSVKDLGVGQSIHAGDMALPEGVTLVSPAEMLVATCQVLAEVKTTEEVEAETPVVPEVIGGEKEAAGGAEEKES